MKRQLQTQIRNRSPHRNAVSRWQSRSNSEPSSTTSSHLDLVSLNRVLSTLLECPVCFEVLTPPIYQCKVGHNVCRACKEKIKVCPLCRQNLVGRNVTIEHISNNLLRECPNKSSGCMEMVGLDDIASHERICPFRKYECLPGDEDSKTKSASTQSLKTEEYLPAYRHSTKTLSDFNIVISEHKLQSCQSNNGDWILPADLKAMYTSKTKEEMGSKESFSGSSFSLCYVLDSHVTSAKKDNAKNENHEAPFQGLLSGWRNAVSSVVKRKNNLICLWTGARTEILNHMKVAHPEMAAIGRGVFDLKISKHEVSVVPAFNEIFWYHLKRDSKKKLLYAVVAYIGPVTNASKYKYKWQLYSNTNFNKVTFTYTAVSDTCNINDLFSSGQAVILSYKVVKQFMDENKQLSWRLKIFVS